MWDVGLDLVAVHDYTALYVAECMGSLEERNPAQCGQRKKVAVRGRACRRTEWTRRGRAGKWMLLGRGSRWRAGGWGGARWLGGGGRGGGGCEGGEGGRSDNAGG